MFDQLSQRLGDSLNRLRGRGKLTEDNIAEALRDVRRALLEADVALPVVKEFVDHVKQRAVGQQVLTSLKPGEALVKVVHDELIAILGGDAAPLALNRQPPVVILMAGLQGAGKTTTTGKLARLLAERENKKVLVASADIYRPAAIDQLETVAGQAGAAFYRHPESNDAVAIAEAAVAEARRQIADVLILDTAGRLGIDEAMMDEIRRVHSAIEPAETLFVVDAMTGQDAANTAKAFHEALPLSGVILTKTDGDARGGAALSVRRITGVPIKFLGTGEKIDGLEPFHPDRLASRILGMGDVLSLVEDVQRKVDEKEARKLAGKVGKGSRRFGLDDFKAQLEQMQKLGGLGALAEKMPGMGNLPAAARAQLENDPTRQMIAVVNSMTPKERRFPDTINGSRKRRIAQGSGTSIQEVNKVLKQHKQMQKMMKKAGSKMAMKKLMKRMPGGGEMPGGGSPGGGGGFPF
ncbi:signal recognition particle protein [Wenzhouxiangella sp. XN79A]|uniref:signal recognition particle protein n=1 Tax=Wenzhouxiangella sp. XN79A TaxID=2724193 RepID=UPI00144AA950|nr:signal recognition particle protein [Wenzhouxiangella sp. XN79A]NKI34388.1 signal recognition particle protein [Wenzhouxiangella sp. XN79A]